MFELKKQLQWSKLKVGAVLSITLFLILITVLFAGNLESLFTPKAEIKALINDVKGLRKGSPVWISGIEVGAVKNITLNLEHGTIVTLSVKKEVLEYVKEDSTAIVMTMGLLGDKYIELGDGTMEAKPITPGYTLRGKQPLDLTDVVQASTESMTRISDFVIKLGAMIDRIDRSEGTLGKFINDPALYNNLRDSAKSLASLLREVESGEGSLQRFMKDKTLYDRLSSAAASLDDAAQRVTKGNGSLAKLVNDPSLYNNLNKASEQLTGVLQDIDAGKGVVGTLTKDEKLAQQVRDAVAGLNEVVGEMKDLVKDVKEHPKKYFKFSVF
jgi:phospholipid/cholesterol/gamma-HCH transport system substrate-binding protein